MLKLESISEPLNAVVLRLLYSPVLAKSSFVFLSTVDLQTGISVLENCMNDF